MKVIDTAPPEVKILEPKVFDDARGFFFESFNEERFEAAVGLRAAFVQDNHSRSARGVLRGLHYQLPPHAQGKLVREVAGEVFDAAVDIRRSSPSFGRWVGVRLSAYNKHQLWAPPGFAHDFLTLSDDAEFRYKTTDYCFPEYERALLWSDPAIGIGWPVEVAPNLAAKDTVGATLKNSEVFI